MADGTTMGPRGQSSCTFKKKRQKAIFSLAYFGRFCYDIPEIRKGESAVAKLERAPEHFKRIRLFFLR